MSFLASLSQACESGKQAHTTHARRILTDFKQECLEHARQGYTKWKYSKWCDFFEENPLRLPGKPNSDSEFMEGVEEALKQLAREEFGDAVSIIISTRRGGKRDLNMSLVFPKGPPAAQQAGLRSNVQQQCPVCHEEKAVVAFTPCGHLICAECHGNVRGQFGPGNCPTCRQRVTGHQNLFTS